MLLKLSIQIWVYFALSAVYAQPQKRQTPQVYAQPQKRQTPQAGGSWDVVKSGQYTVVNCGSDNAALIVNLLETLWGTLGPAIQGTTLPTTSSAFQTFFKDNSYAPYVSQILTNVSTGVSVSPPNRWNNGQPIFQCVTAAGQIGNTHNGDYYTRCLNNPQVVMTALQKDGWVVVCPSFFTIGLQAVPPPRNCLTISTYINRFQSNGASLTQFQLWVLLEEIVHIYIYATTGAVTDVADVNKCVRLSAQASSENARNYLFYVASIYGECSSFPSISGAGRDILSATDPDPTDPNDQGPDVTDPAADDPTSTGVVEIGQGSINT